MLQWADYTSVRQYVISDLSTIVYHLNQTLNRGIPSVVWQQQMEKAYIQRYNNMHMIHKTLPRYEYDYTHNFQTQFRPLPESLHTTHISLTPNTDLTPFGKKTYMIRTNCSTKIHTTNLMIKLKVTI